MGIRIIIMVAMVSACVHGQTVETWNWRNPMPQGNDLRFVRVSPAGVTFVGGEAGTFMYTNNDGESWSFTSNPGGLTRLYSMEIVSEDTVYLTGDDLSGAGAILKTTNGGESWTRLQTGTIVPLYDIRFRTSMFGVACGTNGIVIRTTDGGQSWTQLVTGHPETVLSIDFRSELIGTAALAGGMLLHTADGGETWEEIVASTTGTVRCVRYNAAGIGLAVGDAGLVLQSSIDEGSWAPLSAGPVASLVSVQWFSTSAAIVAAREGVIARTSNGGSSWDTTHSGFPTTVTALAGSDTSHLWICGSGGKSSYSSDAGRTWAHSIPSFDGSVSHVLTSPSELAVALTEGPLLFRREKPENAWTTIESDLPIAPVAAAILDDSTLIAAGTAGSVYRSLDGGESWVPVTSGTSSNLYGSSHHGDTVLIVGASGTVLRSIDGGASFEAVTGIPATTFRAVTFADDSVAVAVGNGGTVLRSGNAGQSWVQVSTPVTKILRTVSFGSSLVGIAGGSPEDSGSAPTIIRTSDGGISWISELIPAPIPPHPPGWIALNTIAHRSNHEYLAGTVEGILLHTTDGGDTWKELRVGSSRDIHSLVWNHDRWIGVGSGGMIVESPPDTTVVSVRGIHPPFVAESPLLLEVFPNPFNPRTTFRFSSAQTGEVSVSIYTVLGQCVGEVFSGAIQSGVTHEVTFDASHLSSGTYLLQIRQDDAIKLRRISLVK